MQAGLYNEKDKLIYTWEELIKNKVIEIDDNKLLYYNSLCNIGNKIIIDNKINYINRLAFEYTHFENIIMSENICNLGFGVFRYCQNLKEIHFSKELKTIPRQTFYNCENLKSIIIPNTIENMKEEIFANCSNLENVKISDNIDIIDRLTFVNCRKLKKIKIPNNVKYINNDVFYGCNELNEIIYSGTREEFKQIEDWKNIFQGNKLTMANIMYKRTLEELIDEGKSIREANAIIKSYEEEIIM